MIAYRDAVPADGPALAEMAARSFTETFGSLYRASDLAAFLRQAYGPEGLPSHLADPAYRARLALENDAIVGFAKLGPVLFPGDWPATAIELHQLYVLGGWQGTGVAAALMEWTIAIARETGASEIALSVYEDNHRAQRFYARHGFVDIGPYIFMVGEQADDERLMRLAL